MRNARVTCMAAGLAAVFSLAAVAQDPAPSQKKPTHPQTTMSKDAGAHGGVSQQDKTFVQKAAMGGQLEVELGKMAADKASSQQCKDLAQKIVDDHTAANEKLMSIARSKGIDIPSQPDAEHQKHKDMLANKSGAAFDKAYVQMMVQDHQKDIAMFERQAKSGSDSELKNFASETLPKLREHYKMAQNLRGKTSTPGTE